MAQMWKLWADAQFLAHGLARAGAEDQTFQQGIAGQAIGAMNAGAGGFSRGVEPGNVGASFEIGAHAAHGVVRGRTNGNQVRRDVDVVLQAGGVNARETFLDVARVEMSEVEIDDRVLGSADFQFVHDGAGHDVARREFRQRDGTSA